MLYLALDLIASNPENIKSATYPIRTDLPAEQGQVIVGQSGVFHPKDLVVKHLETDTILVKDRDFFLTYYSTHLKATYNVDGFAGIVLTNKTLTGNVEIMCHYVGGGYAKFNPTFIVDVVTLLNGVPENLNWDNIVDAPAAVHPNAHKLPAKSIATGYEDFVAVLHTVALGMKDVAEKFDTTRFPIGGEVSTILPNEMLSPKYWQKLDGRTITRRDYPMFFYVLKIEGDSYTLPNVVDKHTYVRVN